MTTNCMVILNNIVYFSCAPLCEYIGMHSCYYGCIFRSAYEPLKYTLNHFLQVSYCNVCIMYFWYPSEMPTETPSNSTATTDQPPTTVPTMAIEVVNVVMNNMENYLPTNVVEQDGDVRYVTIDHLYTVWWVCIYLVRIIPLCTIVDKRNICFHETVISNEAITFISSSFICISAMQICIAVQFQVEV